MTDNIDRNPNQQLNIATGEEVLSRRLVLKRALTFGCGIVLPVVLIGCDSKQSDGSASSAATPPGTPDRGTNAPSGNSDAMAGSPAKTSGATNADADAPAAASTTPQGGATTPAASTTPGKVSQASVRYQDTPNANQNCIGCALFVEPNACSVVEGVIAPEGWCSIWAPKAA